jgi:aspartyl-tRNA(Asn)/glutamyl-tRNA(Gln) amidotransferase subunit A
VSPVELTEFFLERISRFQPALNAYLTITSQFAIGQAKQAEREIAKGRYRGPLHGIPISLKDLFYTAGIRTTAGSKILRRHVPRKNAFVVDRLFEEGAILLGKTNLHEFAFGVTNINPHFGSVHNPWDLKRVPGGSSGGSAAAVSAGLCLASLGTDTGGSIRIPSSACGIVGLKPTRGLVSLEGVIPLASSLDHVGPIGRCVEDVGMLLNILADGTSAKGKINYLRNLRDRIRGLRLGFPKPRFFGRMQKDVLEKILQALKVFEQLGARIQEVDLEGARDAGRVFAAIVVAEALAFHWDWISTRPQDYGSDLRERMEKSKDQPTVVYLRAQEKRREITQAFEEILKRVDVVLTPTLPVIAPGLEEKEVKIGRLQEVVRTVLLRFTPLGNLTGLPVISVPCGFSADHLPIGMQIFGRRYDEATVLRVAYAYEQATPWNSVFPSEGKWNVAGQAERE